MMRGNSKSVLQGPTVCYHAFLSSHPSEPYLLWERQNELKIKKAERNKVANEVRKLDEAAATVDKTTEG